LPDTTTQTIAARARDFIVALPPLSVITQSSVIKGLGLSQKYYSAVNAAFQNNSANTSNTRKQPPKMYFAVRVEILTQQGQQDIYLSLPSVESKYVLLNTSKDFVDQTIAKMVSDFHYDRAALEYWGRAAQRRSVDFIRAQLTNVKAQANGNCLLCQLSPTSSSGTIKAQHIIKRSTIFWECLYAVANSNINIFSTAGVQMLTNMIVNNRYHSDRRYIIPLCDSHDRLVQNALR
jgi:hypothetical protein